MPRRMPASSPGAPRAGAHPPHAVVVLPHRRHPLQARGAGAAGESEEHCLRLVVEGVPEQHRGGTDIDGRIAKNAVAGIASSGFGPSLSGDVDAHDQGVEAQLGCRTRCAGGDLRGIVLQAVIDRQRRRTDTELGCFEGGGRGERERVRAAREGDDDRRSFGEFGERCAHGEADLGDGGRK